jgi:hypothetical protein
VKQLPFRDKAAATIFIDKISLAAQQNSASNENTCALDSSEAAS